MKVRAVADIFVTITAHRRQRLRIYPNVDYLRARLALPKLPNHRIEAISGQTLARRDPVLIIG